AQAYFQKGLALSTGAKDGYQSCRFLSVLLLNSLYEGKVALAEGYLEQLDHLDARRQFRFEVFLGKGVIAAFKGQHSASDEYLRQLGLPENESDQIVPYWKATIAERKKDWIGLLEESKLLRKLSEKHNFREDLPGIYLNFAKGYWGLRNRELALEYAKMSAAMIDGARPVGDASLSLSLQETYHSVYRLLAEIERDSGNTEKAFALSDYLKARVLKDRIENSALRPRSEISSEFRSKIEELANRFAKGADTGKELGALEGILSNAIPAEISYTPDLGGLDDLESLNDTAIISYMFTISGELVAYVWEKGTSVRAVSLSVSEAESELMAKSVNKKIRDLIFFKKDGWDLYDRLLRPLSLTANHIIIIPDKSLWRIPFHALSEDGNSYLIETKQITYSPSAGLLLDRLKEKAPARKSMQVFANNSFENRYLSYVNKEASIVAGIFGTKPFIGATPHDFLGRASDSDILHFSMHAQVDADESLDSFLGFKSSGKTNGRVTVANLLKVRLKSQSLAFLASCDTNNVLSGEGVVSIPWAMLGSGSTSVISAQWEANDRSTGLFAEHFYKAYRNGNSTAKAMQAAAVAMIGNKASATHEPYYWAAFTLLGDYR
ncbi:MAG: CHAT domain-containing protein, partial [Pyrinomonadaceae bacterium]